MTPTFETAPAPLPVGPDALDADALDAFYQRILYEHKEVA